MVEKCPPLASVKRKVEKSIVTPDRAESDSGEWQGSAKGMNGVYVRTPFVATIFLRKFHT